MLVSTTATDPRPDPAGMLPGQPGHAATAGRFYFQADLARFLPLVSGRVELARNPEGTAVLDLPVVPEGVFPHPWYEELSWTPAKFSDYIKNFHLLKQMGIDPILNLDHSPLRLFGGSTEAAGWPVDLYHDEEARLLKTRVELTDLGEEKIQGRRYRKTSAEIADEYVIDDGRQFENVFAGLALTNNPFHSRMPGAFAGPAGRTKQLAAAPGWSLWAPDPNVVAHTHWGSASLYQIPFSPQEKTMADEPETTPTDETREAPAAVDAGVATDGPAAGAGAAPGETTLAAPTGSVTGTEAVTISAVELAQLRRQAALGAEANRLLMEQNAETQAEQFIALGVMPRAKKLAATQLFLKEPKLFTEYLSGLPPVMPVERIGFAGNGTREVAGESGTPGMSFLELAREIKNANPGLSMREAQAQAALKNPGLYRQYAVEQRDGRGRNS